MTERFNNFHQYDDPDFSPNDTSNSILTEGDGFEAQQKTTTMTQNIEDENEDEVIKPTIKKVKTSNSAAAEKERDEGMSKIAFSYSGGKNRAIEALEQFKCSIKSRKPFTNPLGAPSNLATKVLNMNISQIINPVSQQTEPTVRKRKYERISNSGSKASLTSPEKHSNRKDAIKIEMPEPTQETKSKSRNKNTGRLSDCESRGSKISPNKDHFNDDLVKLEALEDFVDFSEDDESENKIPEWALKENARDAKGNTPENPDYDPCTLYIPPKVLDKCTPLLKQYWAIKSKHYDEIVLLKVGDFYRVYYEDAVICHKELSLNWLGNKMIVGVHRKTFDQHVQALVNAGYKVCVAEQTETQKSKKVRIKNHIDKDEKTIKREITQVMSRGTFIDYNSPNYEPRYLLAIRTLNYEVAVTFLEIGYSVVSLGCFQDDEHFSILRTLVTQIRPSEVIFQRRHINPYIIPMLKALPNSPIISPLPDNFKTGNLMYLYEELEKYYGDSSQWPENLKEILNMDISQKDLIMMSFLSIITFLQQALTIDQVMSTARYEIYDPELFKRRRMILDSQALQHLEIVEVAYSNKITVEGSLLSYIDKTNTKYGKRLLRKWICAPLLEVNTINERLDAIEDLEAHWEIRDKIRFELKKLPDFERMCGKIYSLSIKRPDNVILFEDVTVLRLQEFRILLENFETAKNLIAEMQDLEWKSNLLQRLFTVEDPKLILNNESLNSPNIAPILEELSSFIVWEGNNRDVPTPKVGVDKDYDKVRDEISWIGNEFEKYLQEIRSRFNGNTAICYAHTKHRYEIEFPAELVSGSKKPSDFEISSKKKGYERFTTKTTETLVARLEEAEEKLQDLLKLFVCFVFRYFYTYNKVWDRFINGLAHLDCLCSLSVTSFSTDDEMCRPLLFPQEERNLLEIKRMRHPCISALRPNFVPNDISLGDVKGSNERNNIILITGPNMGGKSTILRQACLAAILAQIGCYVPASFCQLSIVDRIFTRIGASDRLIEGKSTFSIELEETLNVLKYGTKNSLVIMDELGRGTTTFDGLAIAHSVLKYIMQKLRCLTLFATHYHILLDDFRGNSDIVPYYMAYSIDVQNDKIHFLYKLTQGECSKSFGLNICKIVGIPHQVVDTAREKAQEFEINFKSLQNLKNKRTFQKIIDLLQTPPALIEQSLEELNSIFS